MRCRRIARRPSHPESSRTSRTRLPSARGNSHVRSKALGRGCRGRFSGRHRAWRMGARQCFGATSSTRRTHGTPRTRWRATRRVQRATRNTRPSAGTRIGAFRRASDAPLLHPHRPRVSQPSGVAVFVVAGWQSRVRVRGAVHVRPELLRAPRLRAREPRAYGPHAAGLRSCLCACLRACKCAAGARARACVRARSRSCVCAGKQARAPAA